jgi:hypothetical protein
VTRDDIAPLGDSEGFPCGGCGGSGRIIRVWGGVLRGDRTWNAPPGAKLPSTVEYWSNCPDCGGSGYGPPPPSLDREMAHCLRRLSEWAHRAPQKEF